MRKKILVIDDNTELLALLRSSLRVAGFSVSTAATGLEGLEKARSRRPDLIVLDLVLPGMDGFAVCEALKRQPETCDTPVIMLTGLPGEFPRLHGLAAGAVELLAKPISPGQLTARIERTLAARRTDNSPTSVTAAS